MEESWFTKDDVISRLATKGKEYTEKDKAALKAGLVEILGDDEDGIAATMEDFGL